MVELQRSVGPLFDRQVPAQLRKGWTAERPVLQYLQSVPIPEADHDERRVADSAHPGHRPALHGYRERQTAGRFFRKAERLGGWASRLFEMEPVRRLCEENRGCGESETGAVEQYRDLRHNG